MSPTTIDARFGAPLRSSPSDPAAIDVLLSSEVGSEGLDFQFCDAMVNYDIPWNPMRIEQRIGRIDRYGQKSETVAIYNFVTPGTVDFDIYDRCLLRIGIFERAIGGSEAILGEIATGSRQVAEDFSLTESERSARLQQLADNEIRQIAETEALEEREAELFGVRIARTRIDDEIAKASSRWLEPVGAGTARRASSRTRARGRPQCRSWARARQDVYACQPKPAGALCRRGRGVRLALPSGSGRPGCAAISRPSASPSIGKPPTRPNACVHHPGAPAHAGGRPRLWQATRRSMSRSR